MVLSVLSLNIWHDAGPWPARSAAIRRWIRRLDPDLIGFQEILQGEGLDLLAELMDGMDYRLDFLRASSFWRDRDLSFGNAVASRWPIADRRPLQLPESGDGETRSALSVDIEAPFGRVPFTVTHLNWRLDHGAVRERQVRALAAHVLAERSRDAFPAILVGDFNADADAAEIRFLCGLGSLEGESVCFHDAWRIAGDGDRHHGGLTWSNRNPYARVENEPDRRLDYIFVAPPARNGEGLIERCRIVCDTPEPASRANERAGEGVWPSDHFGVYAELRTPREPV